MTGRWLKAAGAYLGIFLPIHAVVAVVEASLSTGGPLAQSLYDLSAWSVYYGPALAASGVTAVPLLVFSAQLARNWASGKSLVLLTGLLAPVLFLLNFRLVSAILEIGGGSGWSGAMWLWIGNVPAASVLSSVIYGLVIGGLVSRPADPPRKPVLRWGFEAVALYGIPAFLMSLYAVVLPSLVPRIAYRYSGTNVRRSIEMEVLDTVRVGTPAAALNRQLPGFVPAGSTGEQGFTRFSGSESYGYTIVIDSGRVTELEIRGGG